MFVVLPLLVATVLQQMRHTGSSRLSGSPRSFGLSPTCSHTAVKSQLALPLACCSSQGSHAALCVMSGAGPRLPTQRQRVTDKRVHVRDTSKTYKHANGNY